MRKTILTCQTHYLTWKDDLQDKYQFCNSQFQEPISYPCLVVYKRCEDEYGNFIVQEFIYPGEI